MSFRAFFRILLLIIIVSGGSAYAASLSITRTIFVLLPEFLVVQVAYFISLVYAVYRSGNADFCHPRPVYPASVKAAEELRRRGHDGINGSNVLHLHRTPET
ncbi:hypothetical protein IE4872_PC00181 (plasmid) [Rhizobium gallicum]|uniref:Exopolysaccharide production repressor protein n=4 Tax=Rhizobium TaxID=379 RepID=A0A0B4X6L9_9HYPH|nr:hypothetical protein RGR602_PB00187 [Rhizobium gallicum bv. gallicum R602sp]APO70209.1 hypothetical protein IE4872_PC00181 [Rhizobium gallicum]MBB4276555.1 hypothetical protein [Rhizobium mongolense]TCU32911.1 hypothetical protein EV129_118133 [Rhizobium azibense]TDW34208.1 hypothetical protein EV128_104215 [Rhizobium azibense]